MTITQTALLQLTDQWHEKVKALSAEAMAVKDKESNETAPHTPEELAENTHGLAAGYSAARQELLKLLEVCAACVGTGTTAAQTGTTTMRCVCWKCKGTGMENSPTNVKAHPRARPSLQTKKELIARWVTQLVRNLPSLD